MDTVLERYTIEDMRADAKARLSVIEQLESFMRDYELLEYDSWLDTNYSWYWRNDSAIREEYHARKKDEFLKEIAYRQHIRELCGLCAEAVLESEH